MKDCPKDSPLLNFYYPAQILLWQARACGKAAHGFTKFLHLVAQTHGLFRFL